MGALARVLARSADWLAPPENPSRVVLGVIVTGALLAAESGLHETYLAVFASGVITATLYWLAHAYSDTLGNRLHSSERLNLTNLLRSLAHERAVIRGASIPLVALLVAALAGADRATGVSIAVWTAAVSIAALEVVAALRSHATKGELALEVCVGAAMGVAVIVLKTIAH
jgi:hypothetical protein